MDGILFTFISRRIPSYQQTQAGARVRNAYFYLHSVGLVIGRSPAAQHSNPSKDKRGG